MRRHNIDPPISGERHVRRYQRSVFHRMTTGYVDFTSAPDFSKDLKIPTEEEAEEMVDNACHLALRHKIFSDETKYYAENYKQKRKDVEDTLNTMMNELWKEVPAPHLRLEYTNVLSFFATIREFFQSICESADEDEWLVPTDIVDRFAAYVETIHQIRRYTFVDLRNLMEALNICDEIMKCLQNVHRVRNKLIKDEPAQYPPWGVDRYCSYQYEWFCGSVISGPHHLNCVKWLCASRYNQSWITSFRCDTLAATKETFFDYLVQIPVPFPNDPDNPKQLLQTLYNRENERRDANGKSLKTLRQLMGDNTELEYTRSTFDFFTLRADIRRKKRNVSELIVRCDRSSCISYYLILTTLSRMEAELLLLHKAFAPFIHPSLGMFGKSLPGSVFKICWQIFVITNEKNCKKLPLNSEIESLLTELRKECRAQIKKFHEEYDVMCEAYVASKFSLNVMPRINNFIYSLDVSDFPEEVDFFVKQMIEHLSWEQYELERLNQDFKFTRQGIFDWPKEAPLEFQLNTFKSLLSNHIDAFYSNFALIYPPEIVQRVQLANEVDATTRINAEYFWGAVILQNTQETIDEAKCVPSNSEITQEMTLLFREEIDEDCDLEELTVSELAALVADIVNSHIANGGYRAKYPVPRGTSGTAATAKKLAQVVTETFMEYKQARQYFVLKKQLTPKTKQQALNAARSSQWTIITRLDELHQDLLTRNPETGEEYPSDAPEPNTIGEEDNVFYLAPDPYVDVCIDAMNQIPDSQESFNEIMNTGMFGTQVPSSMINAFLGSVVDVPGLDYDRDFSDMSDRIYNVPVD